MSFDRRASLFIYPCTAIESEGEEEKEVDERKDEADGFRLDEKSSPACC